MTETVALKGTREDYMFVSTGHLNWGTRIVPAIVDPQSSKNLADSVRVDMIETVMCGRYVGYVNLCEIPAVRLGRTIKNPLTGKDEVMGPALARELLVRHRGYGRDFIALPDYIEEMDLLDSKAKAIEDLQDARRVASESRLLKAGERQFKFSGDAEEEKVESKSGFSFDDEEAEKETVVAGS